MKHIHPQFSIIIPVYNTSSYLRHCLDSVAVQSFHDWEAICIDDGSIDDSGTILDSYSGKDSRFRVYHIRNVGVAKARNFGLELVKGNWICFLDSDDLFDKDFLLRISQWTDSSRTIDIIVSGIGILDERTGNRYSSIVAKQSRCVRRDEPYPAVMFNTGFYQCAYRGQLMRELSFKPYTMGEDRLFFFEALAKTRDVLLVPGAYYWYRQRDGSVTKSYPTAKTILDQIAYRGDAWQVFPRYIKRIPRRVLDRMAISLYSMCQCRIRMLSPSSCSGELWQKWYEAIGYAVKIQEISIVHRIIMQAILKCRCNWINYILGVFPSRCMRMVRQFRKKVQL